MLNLGNLRLSKNCLRLPHALFEKCFLSVIILLHILQSIALQCHSCYRPCDLKECILAIHELQLNRKGSSLRAVRNKYMQHKVF